MIYLIRGSDSREILNVSKFASKLERWADGNPLT